MTQKVNVKVIFPDGTPAEFGKEYKILKTTALVWDGRRDYAGAPVQQTGITIVHTVSKGDWMCLMDSCDWRGTQTEARDHPHTTTLVPELS